VKAKPTKVSQFWNAISVLVSDTVNNLEDERPWVNGDLWEERKLQVLILSRALRAAHKSLDERQLFQDCQVVLQYSTKAFLSKYNSFVSRLRLIMKEFNYQQINITNVITLGDGEITLDELCTKLRSEIREEFRKQNKQLINQYTAET